MVRFSIEDTGPHLIIEIDLGSIIGHHAGPPVRFDEIVPGRLWGNYTIGGELVALSLRAMKDEAFPAFDPRTIHRLRDELGSEGVTLLEREYRRFTANVGQLVSRLSAA